MYILSSDFFQTRQKYIIFVYFETYLMTNLVFSHNKPLHLCGQVENYKWIFCSKKTDVKSAYFRFYVHTILFIHYPALEMVGVRVHLVLHPHGIATNFIKLDSRQPGADFIPFISAKIYGKKILRKKISFMYKKWI